MINKNQFKEMARHVLRRQQGSLRDPQIMHPEREWTVGFMVALCIFFFCIFWSIYAYIANKTLSTEPTAATTSEVVVYRESLVKDALERFSVKENVLNSLLGTAPPPLPEPVAPTPENSAASSTEAVIEASNTDASATSTNEAQ